MRWGSKGGGPKGEGPKGGGLEWVGGPKISRFFFLLHSEISLFLLSLNFGGVF